MSWILFVTSKWGCGSGRGDLCERYRLDELIRVRRRVQKMLWLRCERDVQKRECATKREAREIEDERPVEREAEDVWGVYMG